MKNALIYKYFGAVMFVLFCLLFFKSGYISSGAVVVISFVLMLPVVLRRKSVIPDTIVRFCICLIALFLLCPLFNGSSYLYPIKYIAYIVTFLFGYVSCCLGIDFKCKKWILYAIILFPVFFYIFIAHRNGGGMFDLANTYAYYGLSVAMLYCICNIKEEKVLKRTYFILLLYILTAVKLGVVFAFALSVVLYSLRGFRSVVFCIGFGIICIIAIIYVDIPLFVRIRDVYDLASNIPLKTYAGIGESSAYEIGEMYGNKASGENDTSFVFRLVHWSRLLTYWFNSDFSYILFGYGDMYVKERFGLQPHNEYVKFLVENGLMVFVMVVVFVAKLFKWLRIYKISFVFFMPVIYFLTENIVYYSVMNIMVFFALGYMVPCYKFKHLKHLIKENEKQA